MERSKDELLTSAAIIRGLLEYHDRLAMPIKVINEKKDPAITIGLDGYRRALEVALESLEERIHG